MSEKLTEGERNLGKNKNHIGKKVVIRISNTERDFAGGAILLGNIYPKFKYMGRAPCAMRVNKIHFISLNDIAQPLKLIGEIQNKSNTLYEAIDSTLFQIKRVDFKLKAGEHIFVVLNKETFPETGCLSNCFFQMLLIGEVIEEENL